MFELQEKLAVFFTNKFGYKITREEIFDVLFIVYENSNNLEWIGEVWDLNINFLDSLNLLSEFDFGLLNKSVETELIFDKAILLIETKVQIKNNGLIWRIHKYDPDPIPSSPHAHEVNQNIKLDLSNGCFYRKKDFKGKVLKKDLINIREQFLNKSVELPDLNY